MPYKDPEKRREAQKDQMRRRRADKAREDIHPPSQAGDAVPSEGAPSEGFIHLPSEAPTSPAVELPMNQMPLGASAEVVAAQTEQYLATRGWVLWKCWNLNGDIVVVVRDESVTGFPPEYPVFTEAELMHVGDMSLQQLRFIMETKKQNACSIVDHKKGGTENG